MSGDIEHVAAADQEPAGEEIPVENSEDVINKRVGRSQIPCPACSHEEWNPVDTDTLLHLDVPKRIGTRVSAAESSSRRLLTSARGADSSAAMRSKWPGRAGDS